MSKSIFNIQQEYINLLNQLEESDGELTPELEQALIIAEQELEIKSVGYAHVIRKVESDVGIIAAEIKRLQALKKAKETTVERLKTSVETAMELFGIKKVETPTMVLTLRPSESVTIEDESKLPKEFIVAKTTYTPDKVAIKKAIKAGEPVSGAAITINQNLQVK
jgi:hypothetical protein